MVRLISVVLKACALEFDSVKNYQCMIARSQPAAGFFVQILGGIYYDRRFEK